MPWSTRSQHSRSLRPAHGLGTLVPAAAPRRRSPGPRRPRVQEPVQTTSLALLLRLLPAQRHLRGHDALALCDQSALGTRAVPPAAEALVALERRHHAVIATAGALGGPRVAAAHRPQRPIQPRAGSASSATRAGGRSQEQARWPQKSRGHRDPRRPRPRWRCGWSGPHPRGQVGSAAAAAVPTAWRKMLHSEKAPLRSSDWQGRCPELPVGLQTANPPRSRYPAPHTDEFTLLAQSRKPLRPGAPEPDSAGGQWALESRCWGSCPELCQSLEPRKARLERPPRPPCWLAKGEGREEGQGRRVETFWEVAYGRD